MQLIGESSSATGKFKSRLSQLLHWFGADYDGAIVFDECHRAKNLWTGSSSGGGKPTKTGLTVMELQKKLPKARIVYASATGATEPKHMAYMVRLGIWGPGSPFKDFGEFLAAVEKRYDLEISNTFLVKAHIILHFHFLEKLIHLKEQNLSLKSCQFFESDVRF